MANLGCALIVEGRIETTLAKAKALRPFVEKLITRGKRGTLADRRIVFSRLRNKRAVQILFNEKASEFKDRPGGYTRVLKAGFRYGDAAPMAFIELVDRDPEAKGAADKARVAAEAEVAEDE